MTQRNRTYEQRSEARYAEFHDLLDAAERAIEHARFNFGRSNGFYSADVQCSEARNALEKAREIALADARDQRR